MNKTLMTCLLLIIVLVVVLKIRKELEKKEFRVKSLHNPIYLFLINSVLDCYVERGKKDLTWSIDFKLNIENKFRKMFDSSYSNCLIKGLVSSMTFIEFLKYIKGIKEEDTGSKFKICIKIQMILKKCSI